jgi:hypothetical protein
MRILSFLLLFLPALCLGQSKPTPVPVVTAKLTKQFVLSDTCSWNWVADTFACRVVLSAEASTGSVYVLPSQYIVQRSEKLFCRSSPSPAEQARNSYFVDDKGKQFPMIYSDGCQPATLKPNKR